MLGLDGVQILHGKGHFWGGGEHVPVHYNVPTVGECACQCTRRTNAFAAVRGDKTAMRPFAKLLWILVSWCGFSPLFSTSHLYVSLRWAGCCVQLRAVAISETVDSVLRIQRGPVNKYRSFSISIKYNSYLRHRCFGRRLFLCLTASMSVLLTVMPKCTLAASHAAPW